MLNLYYSLLFKLFFSYDTRILQRLLKLGFPITAVFLIVPPVNLWAYHKNVNILLSIKSVLIKEKMVRTYNCHNSCILKYKSSSIYSFLLEKLTIYILNLSCSYFKKRKTSLLKSYLPTCVAKTYTNISYIAKVNINKRGMMSGTGGPKTPVLPGNKNNTNITYNNKENITANSSSENGVLNIENCIVKPQIQYQIPYDSSTEESSKIYSSHPLNMPHVLQESRKPFLTVEEKYAKKPAQNIALEDEKAYDVLSSSDSQVLKDSLSKGLIEHSTAGSYGNTGAPRLSLTGNELLRRVNSLTSERKKENESENEKETNEVVPLEDNSYSAIVITAISKDTEVLVPLQTHVIFVQGDPTIDPTVQTIGYGTSQIHVAKGTQNVEAPKNPKMSDKQPFSGKDQPQYLVPTIPPVIINAEDCRKLDDTQVEKFLQEQDVQTFLDSIKENISPYEPISYDKKGITIDKLRELNDYSDSIKQLEEIKIKLDIQEKLDIKKTENNIQHEEVD